MSANHGNGGSTSGTAGRGHVTVIRLLGLVGLLFFAGLGVGAIVAARGQGSPESVAADDEGPARLASAVSGDRFRTAPSHAPPQTSDREVSEAWNLEVPLPLGAVRTTALR